MVSEHGVITERKNIIIEEGTSNVKNIIVNAFALRKSGALTIYRQFVAHLSSFVDNKRYFIFVDSSVEQPVINGVTYIVDGDHSWKHRLLWEHGGLLKWLKKNNITPDVVVSLQNTGCCIDCRQVIYYHQSIPFYPHKWNFFKDTERMMWLYKYIYPLFVKSTLSSKTDVVVQIPFIKKQFVRKFGIDANRVHVLFPDTNIINIETIKRKSLNSNYFHFLYPATPNPYKEHKTLVEALCLLRENNRVVFDRVRIHFTLSKGDYPHLDNLISQHQLQNQFVMDGMMPINELFSFYKASCGLLFPSTLETLGLPLLEAASLGVPIIAANLDYAHEVLEGYKGVQFADSQNYILWASLIEKLCLSHCMYPSLPAKESTWGQFFKLIEG